MDSSNRTLPPVCSGTSLVLLDSWPSEPISYRPNFGVVYVGITRHLMCHLGHWQDHYQQVAKTEKQNSSCLSRGVFQYDFFYFLIIIVWFIHRFGISILCILHWRAKIIQDKTILAIIKIPTITSVVKCLSLNQFFVSISNFMIIFLKYKIVSIL